MAKTYHVAKTGNDRNKGTKEAPFLTIQRAADVAMPGDSILVHEGEYREWVDPKMGGNPMIWNGLPIRQLRENTSSSKVLSRSPTGKKWKELFGKRKFPMNCLEISILMTPICMATGW